MPYLRKTPSVVLILACLLLFGGCDAEDTDDLPDSEAIQERLAEDWEELSDAVVGTLEDGFAALEDMLDEAGVPDASTPAPANRDEVSEAERQAQMRVAEATIVEETNARRAEHGLPPLEHSTALSEIARDHSRDMVHRSFYAHDNPDGLSHHDRIEADLPSEYGLGMSAENIAYRPITLSSSESAGESVGEDLVQSWMDSPGHRENILREGITHIGVGLYPGSTSIYATQKFISDRRSNSNGRGGGLGVQ